MYLSKFSAEPSARPPETMILARCELRPVELGDRLALESREAGIGGRGHGFDGRRGAALFRGRERAVRTVITFFGSVTCTVWMALPA